MRRSTGGELTSPDDEPMSIAVVYLARGIGGGRPAAEAFLDTYRANPAGCGHRLVLVTKGWNGQPGIDEVISRASEFSPRVLGLPDDGYDWGAYFRAARCLSEEWLCLLNTHSRLCVPGWLHHLMNAASQRDIGAVGATGSWGTLVPRINRVSPGLLLYPWRYLATIGRFPAYPNPHLRSNALLVRRELFLAFASRSPIPASKREAHMLESGRRGFTQFLIENDLRPVVVGKDGNCYFQDDWMDSSTFRIPGQENLLIMDNQTQNYVHASTRMKRVMEYSAWGRVFTNTVAHQ
jgi:hypothetical protein